MDNSPARLSVGFSFLPFFLHPSTLGEQHNIVGHDLVWGRTRHGKITIKVKITTIRMYKGEKGICKFNVHDKYKLKGVILHNVSFRPISRLLIMPLHFNTPYWQVRSRRALIMA